MSRITTKEIVVRMLNERRGEWVNGYELQGKGTKWGFSGVDADTRAHELSRIGYYDSPNNRYYIEHRRQGKYAQFRVTLVEPQVTTAQLVATNPERLAWFNSLKSV